MQPRASLKKFLAEYNQITHLDDRVFSQNSKLSAMNLKSNLIGQLPPDLSIWSHLKEINLSSNKIEEIPESLGELKNCEELKISNNKIK